MNFKKAATQRTVAELVGWVLLAVLLVIIIAGTVTGGLNPLYEKVGTIIDKVILEAGYFISGENSGDCRTAFVDEKFNTLQFVDKASGFLEICRNKCSYNLVKPGDYLNFTKFSIGKSGALITSSNGVESHMSNFFPKYIPNEDNLELAKKHREVYLEFKKLLDDFYNENKGELSKEEFFEPLSYPYSDIRIVVDLGKDKLVFDWDGEEWKRSLGSFIVEDLVTDEQVVEEIYENYRNGKNVYLEDSRGTLRSLVGGLNKDSRKVKRSREEFSFWLDKRKKGLQEETIFTIEVEVPGKNIIYSYLDGVWKRSRFLFIDKEIKEDLVLEELINFNEKGREIVWHYSRDGKGNCFIPVRNPANCFDLIRDDVPRVDDFGNYVNVNFMKEELKLWMYDKMKKVDDGEEKIIQIEAYSVLGNEVYYYSDGDWSKGEWPSSKSVKDFDEVLERVFKVSKKKPTLWRYLKDNLKDVFMVITDEIVDIEDGKISEDKIKFLIFELQKNWLERENAKKNFNSIFFASDYLLLSIADVDGLIRLIVFREYLGEEEFQFTVYWDGEKFILVDGTEKSKFMDYLDFGEDDWNDFLEINEIYKYLYEHCGDME